MNLDINSLALATRKPNVYLVNVNSSNIKRIIFNGHECNSFVFVDLNNQFGIKHMTDFTGKILAESASGQLRFELVYGALEVEFLHDPKQDKE